MTLLTVGYGGRRMDDALALLGGHGVRSIVDVRLRPDRAAMGIWCRAGSSEKRIERWLTAAGVGYRSLPELGNVFLDYPDWRPRYAQLLERAGDLLVGRLAEVPAPFCLLCAERLPTECHRQLLADYLARNQGFDIVHLV